MMNSHITNLQFIGMSVFLILFLAITFGCNHQNSPLDSKVKLRFIRDVFLNYSSENMFDHRTTLISPFYDVDRKLNLSILNQKDSSIDLYKWESNKIITSIDLKEIMNKFSLQEASLSIVTEDFYIFIFSNYETKNKKRTTYLIDQRIIKLDSSDNYSYYDLYKNIGLYAEKQTHNFKFLADFIPSHKPLYANGKIYIGKTPSSLVYDTRTEAGFKLQSQKDARSTHDFIIDVSEDKFQFLDTIGKSPQLYQDVFFDGSYGESNRCITGEGNIIYSSQSVDSVFVYSEKGLEGSYQMRSSKHTGEVKPMSWENLGNFQSYGEHLIESPAYWNIFHDPFRKYTIRVFTEPIPYENDVTINGFEDKPTWLVVADSAFNIIAEIPVPRELRPVDVMYFTKDHVIIEKHPENGIKTNKPVFAVYEWQDL